MMDSITPNMARSREKIVKKGTRSKKTWVSMVTITEWLLEILRKKKVLTRIMRHWMTIITWEEKRRMSG